MKTKLIAKKDGSSYNILLAEDKDLNQIMAVKILEDIGCKVDLVKNGNEAVSMTKENNYDLIFMDCNMPALNGYEATKQIRSSESKGRHVPIIALTAKVMKNDKQKCMDAGMDDYIPKPIKKDSACHIINKWCAKVIDSRNDW